MFDKIISLKNQELCYNLIFIVILACVIIYVVKTNKKVENMTDTASEDVSYKTMNSISNELKNWIKQLEKEKKGTCLLTNDDLVVYLTEVNKILNKLKKPISQFSSGLGKNLGTLNSSLKVLDFNDNLEKIGETIGLRQIKMRDYQKE